MKNKLAVLSGFMVCDNFKLEQAIKLADTQVGRNGQVLTLPLYMGAFHTANRAVHSSEVETSVLQSL